MLMVNGFFLTLGLNDMGKTHLRVPGVDYRNMGQSEHEYTHQTACNYVRDNVTTNIDAVDCKLCLKSESMKHYHQINSTHDEPSCY